MFWAMILGTLALLVLLLWGGRYGLLLAQFSRVTLRSPTHHRQTDDALPTELRPLFTPTINTLEDWGFAVSGVITVESIIDLDLEAEWGVLLQHAATHTYATLVMRRPPEPFYPCNCSFYSAFADRTFLLTINGQQHGLLGDLPGMTVQDRYTADLAAQWEQHRQKQAKMAQNGAIAALSPTEFLVQLDAAGQAYMAQLVAADQIRPHPERRDRWRFSLKGAWQMTQQAIQGNAREMALMQQKRQQASPTDTPLLPLCAEVAGFHWMEKLQQGLLGGKLGRWLLFLSLGIFVASFQFLLWDWQLLGIFVAALLLHELGHLAAMQLFGYRDQSVFFLPFLGAVATGHKEDASLSEKIWVLLAGPLPGLMLGLALALSHGGLFGGMAGEPAPMWVVETSLVLIGLNLFNLLPVYPLDGGQIVNLLLFSRLPYLEVAFKGVAVLVISLLALANPVFFLLVLGVAAGIPAGWQAARLASRLRQQLRQTAVTAPAAATADRATRLRTVYQLIHETGQGTQPFGQRFNLAQTLMQRSREIHASWATRLAWLGVYGVVLGGSLVGSLMALFGARWSVVATQLIPGGRDPQAYLRHELDATTQALARNPDDVSAYLQRARLRQASRDIPGALRDYAAAAQRQPDNPRIFRERAMLRSHPQVKDYAGALADYSTVLRLQPDDTVARMQRAFLYKKLQRYPAAIADFERAIAAQSGPTNLRESLLLGRADTYRALQDYPKALADVNQVIQQNPQSAQAYITRSRIRQAMGNPAGAQADRQMADQLWGRSGSDEARPD